MKSILCFGDSNTWGYMAVTKERHPHDTRWTGVMRQTLGEGYWVIEEGQNGRTTVWDDPVEGEKNGKKYLVPCLESHKPLDLVIVMLGTNDLKKRFSVPAYDIAKSAGVLVDIILSSQSGVAKRAPKVLLVAPPPLGRLTLLAETFEGGSEKSQKFSTHFKAIAEERRCEFLDLRGVITPSDLDGIHYDANSHRKIGLLMAEKVSMILGKSSQ